MKRTRWLCLLAAVVILTLLVSACSGSVQQSSQPEDKPEKIILKAGHVGSEISQHQVAFTAFAKAISEKTNGRIEVEIYPNGALGGERELIESLQTGSVDIACANTAVIANFIPEFTVIDLPYLFDDLDQAKEMLNGGDIGKDFNEKLKTQNVIGLGYWDVGYRNMQTTRPIHSFSDLKGLKFRVMESPIYMTLFDSFNAVPTPMAFTEIFTALQQGTIDGIEVPVIMSWTSGLYQATKYNISTNHCIAVMAFMMSKKTYDKLPDDLKQIVMEAAADTIPVAYDEREKEIKESIEKLQENNIEFIEVDLEPFKAAAEQVYEKLVGDKIPKELVDKIRSYK